MVKYLEILQKMDSDFWNGTVHNIGVMDKRINSHTETLNNLYSSLVVNALTIIETRYLGYKVYVAAGDDKDKKNAIRLEVTNQITALEDEQRQIKYSIEEIMFILNDYIDLIDDVFKVPQINKSAA